MPMNMTKKTTRSNAFFACWAGLFYIISVAMGTALYAQSRFMKPADSAATPEATALFYNLQKLTGKGVLFGHQDDLAYGVSWQYLPGRSDVYDVAGDYPAVYGWDLGHLELDGPANLDGVPFRSMRQFIQEGYKRGAVVTISWHLRNPLTGKSAWEASPNTVAALLSGGSSHDTYVQWLDKVADFLQSLKGPDGEPIPVIFRPFHEWNGDWFWWGKKHCTPEEYKALFRLTVRHLREVRGQHQLLIAFNSDRFNTQEEYLERYPGNDVVDIVGFDVYQRQEGNAAFTAAVQKMLGMLAQIATSKGKLMALTEFGYNLLPDAAWFTNALLPALENSGAVFALAWRNAGKKPDGDMEFFVPYKGHLAAADFKVFTKSKWVLMERDAHKLRLYKLIKPTGKP